MHVADRKTFVKKGADQCVKCGLCLPHCPTYRLTADEAESPRGRIALMQGVAGGQLAAGDELVRHIDQCLSCRACETVCPAEVPYGAMLDTVRAELATMRRRTPRWNAWLAKLLTRRHTLEVVAALTRFAQRLKLRGLLARFTRVSDLLDILPARSSLAARQSTYPAPGSSHGAVALFEPCVTRAFEGSDIAAAVRLLNAAGFDVDLLTGQRCCGALLQHDGRLRAAQTLARRNVQAFDPSQYEALIGIASGCTQGLRDYRSLAPGDATDAFVARVVDIHTFLDDHGLADRVAFDPFDGRIAVHTPCTLANDPRATSAMMSLLGALPDVRLIRLQAGFGCCGAAGTHMLTQRTRAADLVAPSIEEIASRAPDLVVSANIGCVWHLRAAIRRRGLATEVVHPVRLLARQLAANLLL